MCLTCLSFSPKYLVTVFSVFDVFDVFEFFPQNLMPVFKKMYSVTLYYLVIILKRHLAKPNILDCDD